MISGGMIYVPSNGKGVSDERDAFYMTLDGYYVYILNFMKIGTDFRAVIRLCLRNLRGCKVGIIDL
jgi:hypothetical protein